MKSLHVVLLAVVIHVHVTITNVSALQTGSGPGGIRYIRENAHAMTKMRRTNNRSKSGLSAATVGDREPAGVATIFVDKRKKMRSIASVVRPRSRKKGSPSLGFPPGPDTHTHTTSTCTGTKGSFSEINLNLPEWACPDIDEKSRLAEMKYLLKDEFANLSKKVVSIQGVGTKSVTEAFPDVYSDFRLLRFLRKDKVQDPACAADRFRNFVRWRERNDIDSLRALVQEKPFGPPPSLHLVDDYIPCDFCEDDTSEAVPMLLHVGDWDTGGIAAQIESNGLSMETFLTYWAYMFESLTKRLHEDSMKCETMLRTNQICDLTKLNLKQFSPSFVRSVMKPWLSLTQNNYPETAKTIVFIRPPRIMSFVWNLVTPFVSPGTVAKVQMNRKFKGTCEEFICTELDHS